MKKYIYIILIAGIFLTGVLNVSALGVNFAVSCDGLFTAEGIELIRKYLNYFRILGPIFVIGLVAFDLINAVISGDDQNVKRVQKSVFNRIIACFLLFLVPTIVRFFLGLPAVQEKIQIPDDPICHALKVDSRKAMV